MQKKVDLSVEAKEPKTKTRTKEVEESEAEEEQKPVKSKKSKRKREADEEKALDDIESRYMEKMVEEKDDDDNDKDEEKDDSDNESDKESDKEDTTHLIHESLDHSSLINTSEVDKAESTIFIGNLSSIVITEKPRFKEFKALLASTGGKIKSVRFRSIAFSEMLPRKAAFVKHKFHSSRETVNAYAVYDSPESARTALSLNGTMFVDHHMRVDSVAHPGKHDNKRSIFVGNLDFEIDEEPLWKHFSTCGEVEYVRIVRDSKTNVGKGFGYVQFVSPVSVTKALILDGKSVDDLPRGRKLRVSRSKNVRKPMAETPAFVRGGPNGLKKSRLTQDEKTKLGRAKSVLGKAGRAEVNAVLEGTRASKSDGVRGMRNGGKRKKPRIRERSTTFKQQRKADGNGANATPVGGKSK